MSNSVADRLRIAREQAGLSQGQVARLLDMHRPTITEIEAGRRRVDADELKNFASTYDVSVSWLAGEDEEGPNQIDDRIRLAARELAKLKPDDLDKVVRLLQTMQKPAKTKTKHK